MGRYTYSIIGQPNLWQKHSSENLAYCKLFYNFLEKVLQVNFTSCRKIFEQLHIFKFVWCEYLVAVEVNLG